jgi:hypothetical protein
MEAAGIHRQPHPVTRLRARPRVDLRAELCAFGDQGKDVVASSLAAASASSDVTGGASTVNNTG